MATKPKDEFPLNIIEPVLDKFQPPGGDFAPKGAWTHRYALYTIGQRSLGRVGVATVRREPAADGPVLHVDYRKFFPGRHWGVMSARLHCRPDALATPVRWRVASHIVRPDKRPLPHTDIEKTGTVDAQDIAIADGKATRRIARPAACTVNWALFDVVQRLPRKAFEPLHFTLLDHFDQAKANHMLAFRSTTDVLLGGKRVRTERWEALEKGRIRKTTWGREGDRPVRLHAYDHLGDGIVPEVYWVDDQGRLLFMVAGIEAWVWEGAK